MLEGSRQPSVVIISVGLVIAISLVTLIIRLSDPIKGVFETCKQIKGRDVGTCMVHNAVYKAGELEWDPKAMNARRLWLHAKGYIL